MPKTEDKKRRELLKKPSVKSDLENMIELNNQIMLLSKKEVFKYLDEKSKQKLLILQKYLNNLNDSYESILEEQKNVQKEVRNEKRLLSECLQEIGINSRSFTKKYLEDVGIQFKLVEYARKTKDKKKKAIILELLKIIDQNIGEEFLELLYAALLNDKESFKKYSEKCDVSHINDSYYLYDSVFSDISTNLIIRIIEIGNYEALEMFLTLNKVDTNILETVKQKDFIFNNPIIAAIKTQDVEKLELLFKNNANANLSNEPYFQLPIYYAIEKGNHEIFEIVAQKTRYSSLNKKMCLENEEITYLEYISMQKDGFYYEFLKTKYVL